jgi:CRISPR-associated protein Cst1
MLNYTGHPLVDVGIATITAFADKDDPTELSEADLEKVADYITREYVRQPLKSFLTVAFPNSGFTQPAFEKTPERRLDYAQKVLRNYKAGTPTLPERCVFSGQPAVAVAFGDKEGLPPGRAFRQHIPLLTGEEVINFHPYGEAGLPVSGAALLAIQVFPLGCAKCGGRLLAVHSDNPELMLHFARSFLVKNMQAIKLAQESDSSKMPEADYSYRTLLIDTLLPAKVMQREAKEDERPFSITAYHLTNSGQGVGLDMYHLPLEMVGLLQVMESAEYHQDWHALVGRAWEVEPHKKKAKEKSEPFKPRRNWLYEDLFDLPANAAKFIRTYFLRLAWRYAKNIETDPRGHYSTQTEAALVSWKITAKFLERILHMEKERIEQIKKLADTLADYVSSQNDRRFFREFFTVQRYDYFRNTLVKANLAQARRGNAPMLTFEAYISVFEDGEDLARLDWKLARDLVLIRMVERLHALKWLAKNADVIPENIDQPAELAGESAAE